MELTIEEQYLYQALAELAYAITLADDDVSSTEIEMFRVAVQDTMGEAQSIALAHLERINKQPHHQRDLQASYAIALKLIDENKKALNRVLIRKFVYVLEKVASVMGVSEAERKIIDKFENDVLSIHAKKKSEIHQLTPEEANLYSTIGQLAYVVAKADNVLTKEEKDMFRKVVKEKLGEFDWLAEERFKVIDDMMILDVAHTYEHAIYLIKKNIKALTAEVIQKFQFVMEEVAKVSGISKEEAKWIDRFKNDVFEIYHHK
ncbi:MAG: hypothetical protein EAZ85_06280 [Bacteroidetes bacterium]|nr:MAG: hypothetical protein EAZ85_06280 [Bacteroidota bacterium]TAG86539.1 MAG: hypothetical protein EAZ20_12540 [Bacteroidota bacterium]